jgi:hypothetical protein
MVIDRILRRSALMLRAWVGTNSCLSQIGCIHAGQLPGTLDEAL